MIKRLAVSVTLISLLSTNILAITSSAFHKKLFDLLSRVPIPELLNDAPLKKQRHLEVENRRLEARERDLARQNRKIKQKNSELLRKQQLQKTKLAKARSVSSRIAKRTAKNVTRNVSSVVAESIPYLGVAVVVSVTALDVKDGCNTVRDVNEIINTLDPEGLTHDESEVCGVKLPSSDQLVEQMKISVSRSLYNGADKTRQTAKEAYDALGGTLYEIFN